MQIRKGFARCWLQLNFKPLTCTMYMPCSNPMCVKCKNIWLHLHFFTKISKNLKINCVKNVGTCLFCHSPRPAPRQTCQSWWQLCPGWTGSPPQSRYPSPCTRGGMFSPCSTEGGIIHPAQRWYSPRSNYTQFIPSVGNGFKTEIYWQFEDLLERQGDFIVKMCTVFSLIQKRL